METVSQDYRSPHSFGTDIVSSSVTHHDLQNAGTLKAYVVYMVTTEFANGQVSVVGRRYSDFEWLQRTLEAHHKDIMVPHIPEKDALARFHSEVVQYRRREFDRFLSRIISQPTLAKSPFVDVFLNSKDEDLSSSQQTGSILAGFLNEIFGPDPIAETAAKVGMILMNDIEEEDEYFTDASEYLLDFAVYSEEVCSDAETYLDAVRDKIDAAKQLSLELSLWSILENDLNMAKYLQEHVEVLNKSSLAAQSLASNLEINFNEILTDQNGVAHSGHRLTENRLDLLLSHQVAKSKLRGKGSLASEKEALENQEAEENEVRERLKLEDMSKKIKYQLAEFRSTKSLACRGAIIAMAKEQIEFGEQCIQLWKGFGQSIEAYSSPY